MPKGIGYGTKTVGMKGRNKKGAKKAKKGRKNK